MVRHLFVAEIAAADTVSHVWVQHGKRRPRPVRSEDVTETTLETAEFYGASRQAIEAWLKRHAQSA